MAGPAGFEIWQVDGRIHSIDNPVRLLILRVLEEGPQTLNALVGQTAKAKSTLSALHMPPLLSSGLVAESTSEHDQRIKIYRLRGQRLGRSDVEPQRLRDAVLQYAKTTGVVNAPTILHALDLPALVESGARADALDALARRLGGMFAPVLRGATIEEGASEMGLLLGQEGLGRLHADAAGIRVDAANPRLADFLQRLAAEAIQVRYGAEKPRTSKGGAAAVATRARA